MQEYKPDAQASDLLLSLACVSGLYYNSLPETGERGDWMIFPAPEPPRFSWHDPSFNDVMTISAPGKKMSGGDHAAIAPHDSSRGMKRHVRHHNDNTRQVNTTTHRIDPQSRTISQFP